MFTSRLKKLPGRYLFIRPTKIGQDVFAPGDEVPPMPRYCWRRLNRRRIFGHEDNPNTEIRINAYRAKHNIPAPEPEAPKEDAPQDSGATETTTDSPNSKQGGDADKAPEATGDSPPVTDKPVTQEGKDGS